MTLLHKEQAVRLKDRDASLDLMTNLFQKNLCRTARNALKNLFIVFAWIIPHFMTPCMKTEVAKDQINSKNITCCMWCS